METIKITQTQTPAGEMLIGSFRDKICLCDWAEQRHRSTVDRRIQRHLKATYEEGTSVPIENTIAQLNEYFARQRTTFDIPIIFTGSEFQCRVWAELLRVPYGTTLSYADIARRINNPGAVRAVASAIATNPISILVPCHRVIGSNRALTGYAGGLPAKHLLLTLEHATTPSLGLLWL